METCSKIQVKQPSGFFKLGNTHCLSIQGEIYICIGPDWPYNFCLGSVVLGANIFFLLIMAPQVDVLMQYIGLFIYMTSIISYLVIALKNPGIIFNHWEIELEETSNNKNYCKECSVAIEKDSEHCYECQVCIRGYDHHCPLSGKCIGSGNIIPFYIFLISIFCGIFYIFLWIFIVAASRRS